MVRRYRQAAQHEIMRDAKKKYQSDEFKRFRTYVRQQREANFELQRPSVENIRPRQTLTAP